jgi:hypothetical protein
MQLGGTHGGDRRADRGGNLTSLTLADDVQTGGWIRRLQPERPVRTMTVVVVDIDPEHTLQVPRPTISSQSRHSRGPS